MENAYIPGTCNIGKEQVQKRKRVALKCVALTVICIIILEAFNFNKAWRLPMFFLFFASSITIQQVYYKFCFVFGLNGLFSFEGIGKTKKTEEEQSKKLDQKKAWKMIISSLLIGISLTIIYFLLPV